ncbi:cobyrinic acid a,c-diamide synthase [Solemya velum gill symbiont]|uniref:cobyrinate a,c-diamide synthase n=1 Tax=Solemya velum gill symbiont TaxID=2340 RepID=UPI0009978E75|nr:cobyrinate a,c-diamide synthase [Solemya velum gill symbiont]OOZ15948.1 cobyrinic acid a,c-diamide synthase [Solemya velum gill symbiont]OOZ20286.1 cobyrinic acid a,c-diamide synthase [Solemya velum gill symbiont]OOZ23962.1 cobyrinic acid a,c-diamide synthase [Solemya velum gill symbiont]OOZ25777.1 cobyrinic acid a,c-diamide synthase [Solemya velum gill symbiont]OOZ30717.1 cobyrinic acid a,c-diamide synthase [Solemya velum gill symbiont]
MAHFYLSAAHKSSGKTTLSIGLCAALAARGLNVQPFKKGPDYIDPLWLSAAAGSPCSSLDLHVEPRDAVYKRFQQRIHGADIGVIEGNKGLFDGLSLDGSDSNAAVAKLVDAPVILVIDTRGMTRGIAPLLQGYVGFDQELTIAGVILNQVGGARHEGKLRAAVETYTNIPVIGAIPRDQRLSIDERHLGLMPSNEHQAAQQKIESIREVIESHADLDKIIEIASSTAAPAPQEQPAEAVVEAGSIDVTIGVAKDAAFGFYYAEDLQAFHTAGANIEYFDTINDKSLPDVDALFIGGGFPESAMQELEANESMRAAISDFIESGKPAYAECGGLMYLCRSLKWQDKQCRMVGVIDADVVMHERPQGRGYVSVEETAQHPWAKEEQAATVAAHEFHYSRLENLRQDYLFAYEVRRGYGINGKSDGLIHKNLLASYTHLRDVAGSHWVRRFVSYVRRCKERGQECLK